MDVKSLEQLCDVCHGDKYIGRYKCVRCDGNGEYLTNEGELLIEFLRRYYNSEVIEILEKAFPSTEF